MKNPETENLRRAHHELSVLNTISEDLNRSVDLEQALRSTLARVAELLNLKTGWIWLLDEQTGDSYLAAAQNLPPALRDDPRHMEGDCYCLDLFRRGGMEGAGNINVVTCSRLNKLVDGTEGIRYHTSIPIHAHMKKVGVMNVAATDWRELSEDELKLLHTVSDLLGIAIERTRLYERSATLGAIEERTRLARELHDTLAQTLAGISVQLESAEALLESGGPPEKVRRPLHRALELGRSGMSELRGAVQDLRAAPLRQRSLVEALSDLVTECRDAGLDARFDAAGARPLAPRLEVGVYRIAQEALSNVRRHAGAGRVKVDLLVTPEELRLSIEDDGRGLDPRAAPDGRYGLIGMSERAKLLDGKLSLETEPGRGTRIVATVPLRPS